MANDTLTLTPHTLTFIHYLCDRRSFDMEQYVGYPGVADCWLAARKQALTNPCTHPVSGHHCRHCRHPQLVNAALLFALCCPTTGHDPTYIAYKGFHAGLLYDWSVRTENPYEANIFYVPALTYAYTSNLGDVVEHLHRVMTWVRDAHPFFNRTAGRDHYVFLPNDR